MTRPAVPWLRSISPQRLSRESRDQRARNGAGLTRAKCAIDDILRIFPGTVMATFKQKDVRDATQACSLE